MDDSRICIVGGKGVRSSSESRDAAGTKLGGGVDKDSSPVVA
jgi:hypothetical protein